MTDDQIIEAAIQGHASTRDAIRWAIGQVRGSVESIASIHIKDGCLIGSQRKSGVDIPDGQYALYPIGTYPAPAVTCDHEWIRTGAMGDKEKRCIKCGEWGKK